VSAPSTGNYNAPTNVDLEFTVAKGTQGTLTATASPTHIAISGAGPGTTTLGFTGGTGTGAVSYAVTGTGCSVATALGVTTLTATTAATAGCVVTATKTFDANYESISSSPLTIAVGRRPAISGTATAPGGTKAAGQTIAGQNTAANWVGSPTPVLTFQWYICTAASSGTAFVTTETITGCTVASGTSTNINYVLPTLASISPGTFSNRFWRLRVTATVTIAGTAYVGYGWTLSK